MKEENKERNLSKSKSLTLQKIEKDRKTASARYLNCLSLKYNKVAISIYEYVYKIVTPLCFNSC